MSDSFRPHEVPQTRLPCPLLFPWVYSNSCPLSRWCHPVISSSVIPFFSCLQSFPVPPTLFFFNTAELKVHANISIFNKYTVYFFLFQHLVHYFIHRVPLVNDLIHMYVHMCIAYSYHHSPYQTEKHTENITLLFHRPI